MRIFLSLFLVLSLFTQPLAIPASVLAQTPSTPTPTQSGPTSQPTQPPPSPSSSSFSYDPSGNLLSDGERVITWDVEGKPVRIVKGDLETTFLYDSSGARIGKIVKDKQTGQLQSATIYFGGNLEKELNPDGTTKSTTRYYFAGGKRIAQRRQESGKPEELTYIHTDHLSSSTFLTDSSGNKKDTLLTYYPYGETRTGWDSLPTSNLQPLTSNYLYTGQIKDAETDLYYYNARYYNPQIGMFISADNAGNNLNKYAYVNNNPVMFSDPSGHFPFIIIPLIAMGLFILTTPMACDTSVGPAQMTPAQSEFSINTVKMMNPVFAVGLSGAELYRGRKIGSERELGTLDKIGNVADVVLSGAIIANTTAGVVNRSIQITKVKSLPGGEELLKAGSFKEAGTVIKDRTGFSLVRSSETSLKLDSNARGQVFWKEKAIVVLDDAKSFPELDLAVGEHEGFHLLQFENQQDVFSTPFSVFAAENMAYSPFMEPFSYQIGGALGSTSQFFGYKNLYWFSMNVLRNVDQGMEAGRVLNYSWQTIYQTNVYGNTIQPNQPKPEKFHAE